MALLSSQLYSGHEHGSEVKVGLMHAATAAKRRTKTNNLQVAIPHPTSLPYPTFYATFKATLYAARRTPTRRIRTSADVEGRLALRYSP